MPRIKSSSEGKQHYVPYFYLRNFGVPPGCKRPKCKIFVRDGDSGSVKRALINDVAADYNFYDALDPKGAAISIDPALTKIENLIAPAVRRLVIDTSPPHSIRLGDTVASFKTLTDEDSWAIAIFCVTLMARTPGFRGLLRAHNDEILTQARILQERFLPGKPEAIDHLRLDENAIVRDTGAATLEHAVGLANVLRHWIWAVATPPPGDHLIVSDNPVIRVFSGDLVETERLVPLSPTKLLAFTPPQNVTGPIVPKYFMHEMTGEDVAWHNSRQAAQATRYTFAQTAADLEALYAGEQAE